MLREPVHHIAVVAGNTKIVPLAVADDVIFRQTILLTEINAKLHSFVVYLTEICHVGQIVLADFKGNMRVVTGTAAVPAARIPRQSLVRCDGAVGQLSYKAVDTDLPTVRRVLVPVVVILIFSEQPVVRTDIAFQIRIVRAGGMHHDAFRRNNSARLVAGVVGKNEFMQVNEKHLTVQINCKPQAQPGTDGR